jgi:hypothetical protein
MTFLFGVKQHHGDIAKIDVAFSFTAITNELLELRMLNLEYKYVINTPTN